MSDMSSMDLNSRVKAGQKLEAIIRKKLQDLGVWVRNASEQEDKVDKIDGYIHVGGKDASVQIKQRQTGDDIIFEVFCDINDSMPNGRDFNGKADWYACRDRNGKLTLVPTANLKKVAREFLARHGRVIDRPIRFNGAQFRNTTDNHSGQPKLMAYFPTSDYGYKV